MISRSKRPVLLLDVDGTIRGWVGDRTDERALLRAGARTLIIIARDVGCRVVCWTGGDVEGALRFLAERALEVDEVRPKDRGTAVRLLARSGPILAVDDQADDLERYIPEATAHVVPVYLPHREGDELALRGAAPLLVAAERFRSWWAEWTRQLAIAHAPFSNGGGS